MTPTLTVVQLSPSFEQIWSRLAESAGANALTVKSADNVVNLSVCIVAAGGSEEDAASVVHSLRERFGDARIAVAASLRDHRLATRIVRAGAQEYFALPGDMEEMASWLTASLHEAREREASTSGEAHLRFDFDRIVGRSAGIRTALELTSKIIPLADANVLITGETGTGKELIAQAIHFNGPRAHCPFIDINCSALPANLLESEIFGYEAGAFTDARTSKPGLLEAANGGSVFLDEIAEMPIALQAKLLRVLDDRRVRRLGATQSVRIDARVIAATHVDLEAAVAERRFREDLYYRLNVFSVHLPPLRDRGDDVLLLAEHFIRALARGTGRRLVIDDATRELLLTHTWPGNVRELRNAIARAAALGRGAMFTEKSGRSRAADAGTLPFPADMESIQQAAAHAMLSRYRGNKSAAAMALGISRKRLYSLLHGAGEVTLARRGGIPIRSSPLVQEAAPVPGVLAIRFARGLWR